MIKERQADATVRALIFPSLVRVVRPTDSFVEHLNGAAIIREFLTCCREITGPQSIVATQLDRIESELVSDTLHVRFDREERLRSTESTKRTVRRRVREHRSAANADVVAAVRARGVNTTT